MKKILFLTAIGFLLCSLNVVSVFAQARLGIDAFIGMPATMQIGKVCPAFRIVIRNTGTQAWTGKSIILYRTDMDSAGTANPMAYTTANILLKPGDRDTIKVSQFKPESAHFKTGKNIVVIWPASMQGSPPVGSDSSKIEITAIPSVGIEETEISKGFHLYPNPASNKLCIELNDKSLYFEQVRISNISGQDIYSSDSAEPVNISGFIPGIYLVEIRFRNHIPTFSKFIKQ